MVVSIEELEDRESKYRHLISLGTKLKVLEDLYDMHLQQELKYGDLLTVVDIGSDNLIRFSFKTSSNHYAFGSTKVKILGLETTYSKRLNTYIKDSK